MAMQTTDVSDSRYQGSNLSSKKLNRILDSVAGTEFTPNDPYTCIEYAIMEAGASSTRGQIGGDTFLKVKLNKDSRALFRPCPLHPGEVVFCGFVGGHRKKDDTRCVQAYRRITRVCRA